jgi:hypothetical protein
VVVEGDAILTSRKGNYNLSLSHLIRLKRKSEKGPRTIESPKLRIGFTYKLLIVPFNIQSIEELLTIRDIDWKTHTVVLKHLLC